VDDVTLPTELIKCVDKFTQYYESRTSHRKLKHVRARGKVISTYQACILMLFNQQFESAPGGDEEEYTTLDIAQNTKLPMDELKKYLQTLALSKYTILTKNPKVKEMAYIYLDKHVDTDVYTFNHKWE
ncbi:hypothetical protein T484DRAFT_1774822, partial [Baffinella frigidus]